MPCRATERKYFFNEINNNKNKRKYGKINSKILHLLEMNLRRRTTTCVRKCNFKTFLKCYEKWHTMDKSNGMYL